MKSMKEHIYWLTLLVITPTYHEFTGKLIIQLSKHALIMVKYDKYNGWNSSDDYVSQYASSAPKKTDEQSALNRILHETAA